MSFSFTVAVLSGVSGLARAQPVACTVIDRPGYMIDKPGNYCMVKDLFTRFDFADHPAESSIADIRSSNVTIDMQGHRGRRARGPFQAGGNGFKIENISGGREPEPQSLEKVASNEFFYKRAKIRVINVRFDKCKEDFHFVDAL